MIDGMAMQTDSAALDRARRVAESWASHDGVTGVAVFGSVARGASGPDSDTDLLVLSRGGCPSRRELLERVPVGLRAGRFTIVCYERDELASLMTAGTSFSEHLRRESKVLTDRQGVLASVLSLRPTNRVSVRDELDAEVRRLRVYSDLDVFRDNFLFVLARVYSVGKAIVMLGLVAKGKPCFDRDVAFGEFRRRYPHAASSVDVVERLRPFYLRVSRRSEVELPFSYRGCRPEVEDAIGAVRSMAEAVR